jgi:hypothetical protein
MNMARPPPPPYDNPGLGPAMNFLYGRFEVDHYVVLAAVGPTRWSN